MKRYVKDGKTICILINRQGMIYYSNIDKDITKKWLRDFSILDYLPVEHTFNFNVRNSSITVDKFVLDKTECYLILIQPQEDLYKFAYRDPLTSLYNRNYWEHLMCGILQHPMLRKFALVIIDIDNLKRINDNRGHLVGDRAIWIVGKSIRESIRKQDIAVRYGGDEFFVLLANTKNAIVKKVIDRIKENIRKRGKKENIHIEISAGMACSNSINKLEKVITMADYNMYKEKREKKVQVKHIGDELKDIKQKIESVREKLNSKVLDERNMSINKELLELSIKMDKLIFEYINEFKEKHSK